MTRLLTNGKALLPAVWGFIGGKPSQLASSLQPMAQQLPASKRITRLLLLLLKVGQLNYRRHFVGTGVQTATKPSISVSSPSDSRSWRRQLACLQEAVIDGTERRRSDKEHRPRPPHQTPIGRHLQIPPSTHDRNIDACFSDCTDSSISRIGHTMS